MVSVNRSIVTRGALLLILATVVVTVTVQTTALAQGDGIHVVSRQVTADFPNGITFSVTASSSDPIEEIRAFLKPLGSDVSTYGYLDLHTETGGQVRGEYVMTTGTGSTHKPPGTVVRYSFEIRDAAGRVTRTEEEEFLYLDRSQEWLDWKEIVDPDGVLTVYYYGDYVEQRARTVLEASKKTLENMGPVLGIKPVDPIKIVAYSNYQDMSRGLPFRSQKIREDLETQGQAFPTERVLIVLASGTTVTGIASHEFSHILVAEAAGKGYSLVPAWLNEGLAEYANLDPTPEYDWALNYAIFTRRVKPLWYLSNFSGEPNDIVMAYGQGKSAVAYLIDRYGVEKMSELMTAFRESTSTDDAFVKAYGFDQYSIDSQWRQALGMEPFPPPDELDRQVNRTPNPTPVVEAQANPVRSPEPADQAASDSPASTDEGRRSSRSCGSPSEGSAGVPLDVAVVALLAAPFLALNARWGLANTRLVGRLRPLCWVKWARRRFKVTERS